MVVHVDFLRNFYVIVLLKEGPIPTPQIPCGQDSPKNIVPIGTGGTQELTHRFVVLDDGFSPVEMAHPNFFPLKKYHGSSLQLK
jgi:hypothetical protein